jgi:hypothetical protein
MRIGLSSPFELLLERKDMKGPLFSKAQVITKSTEILKASRKKL